MGGGWGWEGSGFLATGPVLNSPQTGPFPTVVPSLHSLLPGGLLPSEPNSTNRPVYSMTVALAAAWQEAAPMMPCRTDSPRGPCLTVGLTARCWRACCLPSLGLWAVLARLAL